jgi:hypothetical protein
MTDEESLRYTKQVYKSGVSKINSLRPIYAYAFSFLTLVGCHRALMLTPCLRSGVLV